MSKETNHEGLPLNVLRANCLGGIQVEGDNLGFIEGRGLGFLSVDRAHGGEAELLDIEEGTVLIEVCAARGAAMASGDWEHYDSFLVPGADKWSWKVAWSVARRLAEAHPGRPAKIAAAEWNAFDHVHLSAFHAASVINADPGFSLRNYLQEQRAWSAETFGPSYATQRILDHIRKELVEIEAAPTDLEEWIDVVILALDGAWRAGYSPDRIIAQLQAKFLKNKERQWPDWRNADPDKAIEHVKTGGAH